MNLFGPNNSIVLPFDFISHEELPTFESRLDEISRYYQFTKLSQMVQPDRSKRKMGKACIVIKNARKNFFLLTSKILIQREIPFTLFLRNDCIGLNRLPMEEEWNAFELSESFKRVEGEPEHLEKIVWDNLIQAKALLDTRKKRCGVLPYDKMDPTRFFGTWGEALEIPEDLIEYGLTITTPLAFEINEEKKYAEKVLGKTIKSSMSIGPIDKSILSQASFETCVISVEGIIEKNTHPFEIKCFK